MLAQMPARLFAEWQAYFQVEPWGEERADLRAGIVAATVANPWRKEGSEPFKPEDFMPKFGRQEEEPEDWRTMLEALRMLTGGLSAEPSGDEMPETDEE